MHIYIYCAISKELLMALINVAYFRSKAFTASYCCMYSSLGFSLGFFVTTYLPFYLYTTATVVSEGLDSHRGGSGVNCQFLCPTISLFSIKFECDSINHCDAISAKLVLPSTC